MVTLRLTTRERSRSTNHLPNHQTIKLRSSSFTIVTHTTYQEESVFFPHPDSTDVSLLLFGLERKVTEEKTCLSLQTGLDST